MTSPTTSTGARLSAHANSLSLTLLPSWRAPISLHVQLFETEMAHPILARTGFRRRWSSQSWAGAADSICDFKVDRIKRRDRIGRLRHRPSDHQIVSAGCNRSSWSHNAPLIALGIMRGTNARRHEAKPHAALAPEQLRLLRRAHHS